MTLLVWTNCQILRSIPMTFQKLSLSSKLINREKDWRRYVISCNFPYVNTQPSSLHPTHLPASLVELDPLEPMPWVQEIARLVHETHLITRQIWTGLPIHQCYQWMIHLFPAKLYNHIQRLEVDYLESSLSCWLGIVEQGAASLTCWGALCYLNSKKIATHPQRKPQAISRCCFPFWVQTNV